MGRASARAFFQARSYTLSDRRPPRVPTNSWSCRPTEYSLTWDRNIWTKNGWDIPGGYVEPGETPREACEREVAEELGIQPGIGPLLVADWAPSQAEGDKILFIFDGGEMDSQLTDQVVLPAEELSEWRFHSEADLESALIPRLARRLIAALEAKRGTRTTYLEHGRHSVG
ncbi:MAG TPA: NUDIX hydrolase [Nocardioidaceae bacterium]|nr:NUDIX hydrolase [Nocardioidaceae bacterium]